MKATEQFFPVMLFITCCTIFEGHKFISYLVSFSINEVFTYLLTY